MNRRNFIKKSAAAAVVAAAAPAVLAQAIDTERYLLLEGPASVTEGQFVQLTGTIYSGSGKKVADVTKIIKVYVDNKLVGQLPLQTTFPKGDALYSYLEPGSV